MTQYLYRHRAYKDTFLTFNAKDDKEAWAMIVQLTNRPRLWELYHIHEGVIEN